MSNMFSRIERELIIRFLYEEGSSVRLRYSGKQYFFEKDRCEFSLTEIIINDVSVKFLEKVQVELFYKKRGIYFSSLCKNMKSVLKIPIPDIIYKLTESYVQENLPIKGVARKNNANICFRSSMHFPAFNIPWQSIPDNPYFYSILKKLISSTKSSVYLTTVVDANSDLINQYTYILLAKTQQIFYVNIDTVSPIEYSFYSLFVSPSKNKSLIDKRYLKESQDKKVFPFDVYIPLLKKQSKNTQNKEIFDNILCCSLARDSSISQSMKIINSLVHQIIASTYFTLTNDKTYSIENRLIDAEILFLDDSFILIGGNEQSIPEKIFCNDSVVKLSCTIGFRVLELTAIPLNVYVYETYKVLSLSLIDIQEENKRFLFERQYGEKYKPF